MSILTGLFSKIAGLFTSPRGQAVARAIEAATIDAAPIVAEIAVLVPSRTFTMIAAAYAAYAVPFALKESQLTDPVQQGLALRDLATTLLKKNHQDAGANVLNAAVEIAVAGHAASGLV